MVSLLDLPSAAADLGAQRVLLCTFHGSPLHNLAIEAGVRLLTRRGLAVVAPFNRLLRRLLTIDVATPAKTLQRS